jgi:hypothetical protein
MTIDMGIRMVTIPTSERELRHLSLSEISIIRLFGCLGVFQDRADYSVKGRSIPSIFAVVSDPYP